MRKLLLVEDDTALIAGLVYALEMEGMQLNVAQTMSEAHAYFEKGGYDMILLDMMLPDGNGLDFCQYVRTLSKVPIIFLTANDEEFNIIMGLDRGADDYITKPFRIRELISRINAVMRRGGGNGEGRLCSGCIVLDTKSLQLKKQDESILLSALEFRLLLTFMQNPKQVLTRQQLLAKLWDDQEQFVEDNTLSVNIRRLREKLGFTDDGRQYIKTVRGMGYIWQLEVTTL